MQIPVIEWLLRPSVQAFFKPVPARWSPGRNYCAETLDASHATGLLQGQHDYMFTTPYNTPRYLHCGPQALSMLRTIKQAILDFLDERKELGLSLSTWDEIFLLFATSHLLRDTNARFEMVRYLETLNRHVTFPDRHFYQPEELMSGFHNLLRTWELWFGFHRATQEQDRNLPADGGSRSYAAAVQRAPTAQAEVPIFDIEDQTKRAYMNKARESAAAFRSSQLKDSLRPRRPWSAADGLAAVVYHAGVDLVDLGLLVERGRSHRGPHWLLVAAQAWEVVQASPGAVRECDRLRLSREHFL